LAQLAPDTGDERPQSCAAQLSVRDRSFDRSKIVRLAAPDDDRAGLDKEDRRYPLDGPRGHRVLGRVARRRPKPREQR
jgi:hypothetical protein